MSDSRAALEARATELGLNRLSGILRSFGKLPLGESVAPPVGDAVVPHVAAFARLSRAVPGADDIATLLAWLEPRPDERALFAWDLFHNQIIRNELELARLRSICRDKAPLLL